MNFEIDMGKLSTEEKDVLMRLINKCDNKFDIEMFETTVINRGKDTISDIKNREWNIGESLFVPMKDGRTIEFIAAHTNKEGKTYFVSKDCVGKSKMVDMKSFLFELEANMPDNLLAIMKGVCHSFRSEMEVFSGTIFIPSMGNLVGAKECYGKDDEQFELFKTKAGRVARLNDSTTYWWTDTPLDDNVWDFWVATTDGTNPNGFGDHHYGYYGVRVGFKI